MLSPSGKVAWVCNQCKGPHIQRVRIGGQKSFACECGYFGPWRSRLKYGSKPKMTTVDASGEVKS